MTERILTTNPILDGRDEIEDLWLKNKDYVLSVAQLKHVNQIDQESTQLIVQQAHKAKHDEIQIGICTLYLFAPNDDTATKWFNCMMISSRDSLQSVISKVQELVLHKFLKLTKNIKNAIMRLLRELAKASLSSHAIINILLRQMIGGDLGHDNLWLVESVLDVCLEFKLWLEKNQECLQLVFFRYLRLVQDHATLANALSQKEIQFTIGLLRTNFSTIMLIGRDLIRLLLSIVHIPEFQEFWRDLVHKPSTLGSNFTSIKELMKIRTSKKFLVMGVTFDMESKITFLLTKVKFGQHETHQKWFQKFYLTSLSSVTLRADIIRFVCTCIIPTNEILQSDVLPRWAFCGWILSNYTNLNFSSTATCRLALIYDWLLFNESRNTIMDIEPCILLMHHSRRNHPAITYGLLDCILRTISDFHEPIRDEIRRGVINAFRFILKLGVVRSIAPIICEKQSMPPDLHPLVNEYLVEFMPKEKRPEKLNPVTKDIEGKFSDDEDSSDVPSAKHFQPKTPPICNQDRYMRIIEKMNQENNKVENFEEDLSNLRTYDDDVANLVEVIYKLSLESSSIENDEFYHQLDSLLKNIQVMEQEQFDGEMSGALGKCLAKIFRLSYSIVHLPTEKTTTEEFDDMISRPLYILFRILCEGSLENSQSLSNLLSLTASIQLADERTGYHLLYFITIENIKNKDHNKWFLYDQFCGEFANDETDTEHTEIQLLMNLGTMKESDPDLLIFLVPFLYREFPKILINNIEFINSIMSCISPKGILYLQPRLRNAEFKMFSNVQNWVSLKRCIKISFDWESFEQQSLWTLITSHRDVKIDNWIPIFPHVEADKHPEAMSAIWTMLRNAEPSTNIVKWLLARDQDEIVLNCLYKWSKTKECREKVVEAMVYSITRAKPKASRKSSRQSGRNSDSVTGPTIKQVLIHLNAFRFYGDKVTFGFYNPTDDERNDYRRMQEKVFSNDSMMAALLQLKDNCDSEERAEYAELFNVFANDDSDDDIEELQPKRKEKKRKANRKKNGTVEVIDSDSDDDQPGIKKKRM